jgi:hypothetical protein
VRPWRSITAPIAATSRAAGCGLEDRRDLAEEVRAEDPWRDDPKTSGVDLARVLEVVDGAARDEEHLAGTNVRRGAFDRPRHGTLEAVSRLVVAVVAVRDRHPRAGGDMELEDRDRASRFLAINEKPDSDLPNSDLFARSHAVLVSANAMTDASKQIDERIRELGDWRGETLGKVRGIIKEADPDVVEEWKWAKATSPGTPVWSHDGGICTGETYKNVVKLTFFKGAALNDPSGLFNSSLEGKVRRAIDIKENDKIDEAALKNLIREAVALNTLGS